MILRIKIHGKENHLDCAQEACRKIKEAGADNKTGNQQHFRIGYGQVAAGNNQHGHKYTGAQRSENHRSVTFPFSIIFFAVF